MDWILWLGGDIANVTENFIIEIKSLIELVRFELH
jgi:hypothetical protein